MAEPNKMLEETANYLLNHCFVLGGVEDQRAKYLYVQDHLPEVRAVFAPLGYAVTLYPAPLQAAALVNEHEGSQARLLKYESILLLVLRLLYLQKRESLAASADQVLVTVEEVQTELQKMNLPRRLDQQTLDAAWFGSVEHLLECVAGLIIGTELLWKKLRSAGRQILVTTVTESLGTFAVVSLVFACVFRITGVPVYLAFLSAASCWPQRPAPSLSIVNELKTNGPVTRTLMPMAALDDLVGATVFFVVVALVSAQISSVGIPVAGILVLVFLPVPLGGAMGFWAGCRMCRARTPAPGLWYHAGPACSHRRTGRAGKCASAGSCAELHAAGHVLFRGICQLHSRRPSGKHHACDESRHRGGADCGHFEPGCAAGLSSVFSARGSILPCTFWRGLWASTAGPIWGPP